MVRQLAIKLPKSEEKHVQRPWGRTRPGLLEEEQEAFVASERIGSGGGEDKVGRAGHIGPVGLLGRLPPKEEGM